MKRLETLLLRACGFTIAILTLFYTFAAADNAGKSNIDFSVFALIFGFGLLVSIATMILEIKAIKLPLRILIHYVVLMITFCVVFISTGNIAADSSAKTFTAVIIFTVFYALFFGLFALLKKIVNLIDTKIDRRKTSIQGTKSKAENKKQYKSLYSDK